MKKILLGLFLAILFFFVIHKNQAVGYVIAQQGQGGAILQQGVQAVQNAVTQPREEKEEAEAKKKIEDMAKQLQKCDFPGDKCCVGKEPPKFKIPFTERIVDESKLPSIDNPNDPLSPVWCAYDSKLFPTTFDPKSCICILPETNSEKMCERVSSPSEKGECLSCSDSNKHDQGVWTALGCVDSTLAGFIKNTLLGWGIGLAGVLAMLCIIYSAFVVQTSSGNPEKIKKAKERLTACIVGLLLIIFSVFILKLVGVDILQIPGFGK